MRSLRELIRGERTRNHAASEDLVFAIGREDSARGRALASAIDAIGRAAGRPRECAELPMYPPAGWDRVHPGDLPGGGEGVVRGRWTHPTGLKIEFGRSGRARGPIGYAEVVVVGAPVTESWPAQMGLWDATAARQGAHDDAGE